MDIVLAGHNWWSSTLRTRNFCRSLHLFLSYCDLVLVLRILKASTPQVLWQKEVFDFLLIMVTNEIEESIVLIILDVLLIDILLITLEVMILEEVMESGGTKWAFFNFWHHHNWLFICCVVLLKHNGTLVVRRLIVLLQIVELTL